MAEGETVDSGEKPLNEFGYKQDLWRDGIAIQPCLFLHVFCLFVTYSLELDRVDDKISHIVGYILSYGRPLT
jgi:hypothetical protein